MDWKKLRVTELKEELEKRKLPIDGIKDILVQRLEDEYG